MYRILIVDDEPQILEGLTHIIDWEEHGVEIAGQAHNGAEALEILMHTKIHMLLTDIRMPEMDGLELIRRVKQKGLSVRTIILSGFDDFEYIKEAVKLGMENYLLKPVDREELSSTLATTIEKIEKDLYKDITERQGLNIFRENLLNRWLCDTIPQSELAEKAPLVNLNPGSGDYTAAVVRILHAPGATPSPDNEKDGLAGFAVRNICSELAGEGESAYTFIDLDGDVVILFHGENTALKKQEITGILSECLRNINRYLGLEVFITVGNTVTGFSSAHESYSAAKELLGYSLLLPANSMIDQEDNALKEIDRQEKFDMDMKVFKHFLEQKMAEECCRFIDESFTRMCALKGITPVFVRNAAIDILYHISSVLKAPAGHTGAIREEVFINFSDVYRMNTIDELASWLKLVIRQAVGLIRSENDKYSPMIRQILDYIQQNYNKDISIKLLSSSFNINAAYLGQLFKNETGEMLTNYVNGIRIEKAKEMLVNTNLKASEISERVGYPNTNYFYRIFKKITGISPTEYR